MEHIGIDLGSARVRSAFETARVKSYAGPTIREAFRGGTSAYRPAGCESRRDVDRIPSPLPTRVGLPSAITISEPAPAHPPWSSTAQWPSAPDIASTSPGFDPSGTGSSKKCFSSMSVRYRFRLRMIVHVAVRLADDRLTAFSVSPNASISGAV
jgi:hypothetical protein